MVAQLKIKIITPREIAYDGAGLAVTIPAEAGEMQVYPGHIPVLAKVKSGTVRIEHPGAAPTGFDVDEGFFRVTPDEVHLLIDTVRPL
ncbi:MAG: F0F1 ATP synthase subunit epsilon [Kiritimatiellales bacterium]